MDYPEEMVSIGFLVAGSLMVVAGALLVYLSLKGEGSEDDSLGAVKLLGLLPVPSTGARKWLALALAVTTVVLLALAAWPYLVGMGRILIG